MFDHVDVWVRALKTGLTALVVTFAASAANWASLPDLSSVKKLGVAALMAAGTAILNYLLQAFQATKS